MLFAPPSQFQEEALLPVPADLPHTPGQLTDKEVP